MCLCVRRCLCAYVLSVLSVLNAQWLSVACVRVRVLSVYVCMCVCVCVCVCVCLCET
jgi:hypothetical protein